MTGHQRRPAIPTQTDLLLSGGGNNRLVLPLHRVIAARAAIRNETGERVEANTPRVGFAPAVRLGTGDVILDDSAPLLDEECAQGKL